MKRDTWPIAAPGGYLPCGAAARLDLWPTVFRALRRLVREAADRLDRWRRHRRTLKALSKLDQRALKDIGLPGGFGSIDAAARAASYRLAANENRDDRAA